MNLEKIRESLTSKISPVLENNYETKLSSVLIIIFDDSPNSNDKETNYYESSRR